MLIQSVTAHGQDCHAALNETNTYLVIKEQVGQYEHQTVDLFIRLTPGLAKEIDFALSVYAQELEHG